MTIFGIIIEGLGPLVLTILSVNALIFIILFLTHLLEHC